MRMLALIVAALALLTSPALAQPAYCQADGWHVRQYDPSNQETWNQPRSNAPCVNRPDGTVIAQSFYWIAGLETQATVMHFAERFGGIWNWSAGPDIACSIYQPDPSGQYGPWPDHFSAWMLDHQDPIAPVPDYLVLDNILSKYAGGGPPEKGAANFILAYGAWWEMIVACDNNFFPLQSGTDALSADTTAWRAHAYSAAPDLILLNAP